jgi:hypothetical protein
MTEVSAVEHRYRVMRRNRPRVLFLTSPAATARDGKSAAQPTRRNMSHSPT